MIPVRMHNARKLSAACVILLLATATNAAQVPCVFCEEPEYRFGQVDNTNIIEHDFKVSNTGKAELRIKAVRPDCGCIALRAGDLVVQPGGYTTIKARLSLTGFRGVLRKRIIIESNDPNKPFFVLSFSGEAITGVEIRPERIMLGSITFDSNDVHDIDFSFRTNRLVRVLHVDVSSPFFEVRRTKPAAGFQYRVSVSSIPPFQPGGINASVVILTDHPEFPRLEVPITGRVVADVYVSPEEIVVDPSRGMGEVVRLLVVRSIRKQPFKILSLEPSVQGIRARFKSMRENVYRVELRFTPDSALDGETLKITTDFSTIPVLEIPFKVVSPPTPEEELAEPEPLKDTM